MRAPSRDLSPSSMKRAFIVATLSVCAICMGVAYFATGSEVYGCGWPLASVTALTCYFATRPDKPDRIQGAESGAEVEQEMLEPAPRRWRVETAMIVMLILVLLGLCVWLFMAASLVPELSWGSLDGP